MRVEVGVRLDIEEYTEDAGAKLRLKWLGPVQSRYFAAEPGLIIDEGLLWCEVLVDLVDDMHLQISNLAVDCVL